MFDQDMQREPEERGRQLIATMSRAAIRVLQRAARLRQERGTPKRMKGPGPDTTIILRKMTACYTAESHTRVVSDLQFSPDGKLLATTGCVSHPLRCALDQLTF